MQVLALDLSTKSSGWSLFEDTKLIHYGCIASASKDVIVRIRKMASELQKIIEANDIEKIVIEEVRPEGGQYGVGNLHTQKVLMWLQAAIVFMIHDLSKSITIEYVLPSEWRAACGIHTGRGIKRDPLKNADIKFVKDTYNISTLNDDIADAICIGHAFVNKLDNEINWE